jgi:hypothetical protein
VWGGRRGGVGGGKEGRCWGARRDGGGRVQRAKNLERNKLQITEPSKRKFDDINK